MKLNGFSIATFSIPLVGLVAVWYLLVYDKAGWIFIVLVVSIILTILFGYVANKQKENAKGLSTGGLVLLVIPVVLIGVFLWIYTYFWYH